MKIIPFDIALREQIQSEENHYQGRYKVQTRSGNTVRIVCWDKKDFTFPIVALVEDSLPGPAETTLSFCQDGMYFPRGIESNNDLCLLDTLDPKFKVGDRVRMGDNTFAHTIVNVRDDGYVLSTGGFIEMRHQSLYSLVPAKTSNCFSVGEVIKCVDTGRLWLVCEGHNVLSDGHTTCTGGLYEVAGKEDTDKFFTELDRNGYKYSPVLGTITKKPKFKIGDRVRYKNGDGVVYRIADILECHYLALQPDQSSRLIPFEDDDHLEIAPAKTAEDFKVGQVLKCLSTGRLWLRRDGDCVKSDGHTVSIGGAYEAASQEESDKFFKELDENGYIWNPEKRKIEKKEPELTDFEQEVRDIVTSALTVTSEDGSCSLTVAINDETARKIAVGINKLVTKKLFHERF